LLQLQVLAVKAAQAVLAAAVVAAAAVKALEHKETAAMVAQVEFCFTTRMEEK
jgi:hypothetical protein